VCHQQQKIFHHHQVLLVVQSSFLFFPGLNGLPLPTTPSTKRACAGQLSNKRKLKGGAQTALKRPSSSAKSMEAGM